MKKIKELSPYEKTIRNRLIKLINEYCEGSQSRFVERTGINQGLVSQYVNGKNSPSWETAVKIASAFNIDVGWVMATDTLPDDAAPETDEEREVIDLYHQADPAIRESVMILLKSSRRDP